MPPVRKSVLAAAAGGAAVLVALAVLLALAPRQRAEGQWREAKAPAAPGWAAATALGVALTPAELAADEAVPVEGPDPRAAPPEGSPPLVCARGFSAARRGGLELCEIRVPGSAAPGGPLLHALWDGQLGYWTTAERDAGGRKDAGFFKDAVQKPVVCPPPFAVASSVPATQLSGPACLANVAHGRGDVPQAGALRRLVPHARVEGDDLVLAYGVRAGAPPHACPPGGAPPASRRCRENEAFAAARAGESPLLPTPADAARQALADTPPHPDDGGGGGGRAVYLTVCNAPFADNAARWYHQHHGRLGLPAVVIASDDAAVGLLRDRGVRHVAYRPSRSPPVWCADGNRFSGWRQIHEVKVGGMLDVLEAGIDAVMTDADVLFRRRPGRKEWEREPWTASRHDLLLPYDTYWLARARATPASVALHRAVLRETAAGGWDQGWMSQLAREWGRDGRAKVGTVGYARKTWIGMGYGTNKKGGFPATIGDVLVAQEGPRDKEFPLEPSAADADAAITFPARRAAAEAARGECLRGLCVLRLSSPPAAPRGAGWVNGTFSPVAALLALAEASGCAAALPAGDGALPVDAKALREGFAHVLLDEEELEAVRAAAAGAAAAAPPPDEVDLGGPPPAGGGDAKWAAAALATLGAAAREAGRAPGCAPRLFVVDRERLAAARVLLTAPVREALPLPSREALVTYVAPDVPYRKWYSAEVTLPCMHDNGLRPHRPKFKHGGHATCCRKCRDPSAECFFSHDRMVESCKKCRRGRFF